MKKAAKKPIESAPEKFETKPFPKFQARPDRDRRVRQSDRIARVLRVLNLIRSRGRWNAKSISQELQVTERTVYRDLDVLTFAGVPWEYDEHERCYRVRPDFQFPVVNLNEEEAIGQAVATNVTTAIGLDASPGALGVTRKLAISTSEQAKETLALASQLIEVLDLRLADHSQHHAAIRTSQSALMAGKQLSGVYETPYEKAPIKLALHPYRLCLVKNAWYLVGHIEGENSPKTFRIARFKSLRQLDRIAKVPTNFDLKSYFGNAWSVYRGDERYEIRLKFLGTAAKRVVETIWHSTQKVKLNKDGTVEMDFVVDGLDEILNWILSWTGQVIVESPPKLRGSYVAKLKAAMKLQTEDSSS